MATTYVVTGVDRGVPQLPNDSVIAGLKVGDTFTSTLDSGVEAELIAAGLIAKSPVPSPVSMLPDGSLVAADGRTPSGGSGSWGEAAAAQFSGSGSPVGVVTPTGEGDLYIDNTTPALWQASGATSADWQPVGWTPPGPVQEIDWLFPSLPTQLVKLAHDPYGLTGAIALFNGGSPGNNPHFGLYDPNVASNGTIATPAAAGVQMGATKQAFIGAFVTVQDVVSSNGGARMSSDGNDAIANSFHGTLSASADSAATAGDLFGFALNDFRPGGGYFAILYGGALTWATASGVFDVTLERAAAGVLQIPQAGGGIKLTSPDGTQTKQIQLSNAGALVVV